MSTADVALPGLDGPGGAGDLRLGSLLPGQAKGLNGQEAGLRGQGSASPLRPGGSLEPAGSLLPRGARRVAATPELAIWWPVDVPCRYSSFRSELITEV